MNWFYKIDGLKKQFKDDVDDISKNDIIILCNYILYNINKILKKDTSMIDKKIVRGYSAFIIDVINDTFDSNNCFCELSELKDNFEFLRDLCNGTIPENEFDDYGFDGDYVSIFNDYLDQLYDIGDNKVEVYGHMFSFIWIG